MPAAAIPPPQYTTTRRAVSCVGLASAQQRAALGSTRGTSSSGGARRAAALLVVGEVALAGILLVGAGLTLRSFANALGHEDQAELLQETLEEEEDTDEKLSELAEERINELAASGD